MERRVPNNASRFNLPNLPIGAMGAKEIDTPKLRVRKGINASDIVFVGKEAPKTLSPARETSKESAK